MRVLLIGVNFAPEVSGIAPYTSAMATGLQEAGHSVRVITGVPHYPQWKNFTDFAGCRRDEVINGVTVRRVRHFIGSGGTGIGRVLQEATFGLHAAAQNWRNVDVIICVSPALISCSIAVVKARLTGRPVGVWVQDLYANGARELGNHVELVPRMLGVVESWTLRAATGVLVIHERFRSAVVETLGVQERKVTVCRNWSHLDSKTVGDPQSVRAQFFEGADIVAIHAGNMGAKQGLSNIVEAARLAERRGSRVTFGLVGDGSQRQRLQREGANLTHLVFVPSLAEADFMALLRCADVLVVNEREGLRESAVPSKLTSYFVQGKPVVAATESDSATAAEVTAAGAGPVVQPGRPQQLLDAVEAVAAEDGMGAAYGQSAQRFAAANLTASSAVRRLSLWLDTLL